MNCHVFWISRHPEILARGYHDENFLDEGIFGRQAWTPPDAITFEHHEVRGDTWPEVEGAVVVLPSRHHASVEDVAWFQERLEGLKWSVVVLAGDEEWAFDWRAIPETMTRSVIIMQPRKEHEHLTGIPGGPYPGTHDLLARPVMQPRTRDWFFAGQDTHRRRHECVEVLRGLAPESGMVATTDGYLKEAIPRATYFALMAAAKVIPCPSGPCHVDTARVMEALEAGCVPVADAQTPREDMHWYWKQVFGYDCPIPVISDWADFPRMLEMILSDWTVRANRCFAHWQAWKRGIVLEIDDMIRDVMDDAGIVVPPERRTTSDAITAIVTTSPVSMHPDTAHIEETIASIRAQLPLAEILIVADGVRPEQEHLRADYEEYLRRLLHLCNFEWHNVLTIISDDWLHQAGTVEVALRHVRTPMILFAEHDTPLCGTIDWDGVCAALAEGWANVIRFHFDVAIHPDHEAVMVDHQTTVVSGIPLRRTAAWWMRPHVATTAFYRERIMPLFKASDKTMIEDAVYSVMMNDWTDHGLAGWDRWKVWMYTPEGNMQRSRHLDSRASDPKFEMTWERPDPVPLSLEGLSGRES